MARRQKKPTNEELIEKLRQDFEEFRTLIDSKIICTEEKQNKKEILSQCVCFSEQ